MNTATSEVAEEAALTIDYRPGIDLEGRAAEKAMGLMERLVAHYKGKTTEQADDVWLEPMANYRDDELFTAEVELLFKQIPMPLALSVELDRPNAYKAVDVAGVPVLITRDSDGNVHAMLNICRHRGAAVCAPGRGMDRALVCKYHAWSYGMDGTLQAIYGDSTFGNFEKNTRGLIKLACEERHGVVFVCLTPGRTMDLDSWLGDFAEVLEDLRLTELVPFSSRMMPGPGWKVVAEGYLEGYHFASLHKDTVFTKNLGNISAFDSYGPHARIAFGLRPLAQNANEPADTWVPADNVGPIVWLFPGLSIAGGWRDRMSVSFPMVGATRTETVTEQRIMTRRTPSTPREQAEVEFMRDWFYDVVYNEDYLTAYSVQKGVNALPEDDTQIFGRNEIGVQHLHQAINSLMAERADGVHSQPRVAQR
jgi:phenylpropionate dioxygenase-like ring-hydroxylating dioxygenase large terminal subunit